MTYDKNLYAEVVFDGDETHAPARMGTPKEGQLQGRTLERLAELCGRVCYDSLGKGRSSAEYHAHIREVKHGSVLEHANFTIEFRDSTHRDLGREMFPILANRPGVWIEHHERGVVRVTLNLRSAVEWARAEHNLGPVRSLETYVHAAVFDVANRLAPMILPSSFLPEPADVPRQEGVSYRPVKPEYPEEKWVSLLLGGSRGMSHEQVRHKWRVAISQRSTRYVDESESPWVEHPLITLSNEENRAVLEGAQFVGSSQAAYRVTAKMLQAFLTERGADSHTARKQARGAARGLLGNALHTELIFSASVAQWRRMIEQRCSQHADAEIRVLYGHVVNALRTTRWASDFEDIRLAASPDGIGQVAQFMED